MGATQLPIPGHIKGYLRGHLCQVHGGHAVPDTWSYKGVFKGAISVRYMGATQLPIPGHIKGYLRGHLCQVHGGHAVTDTWSYKGVFKGASLSGTWGPRSYRYLSHTRVGARGVRERLFLLF